MGKYYVVPRIMFSAAVTTLAFMFALSTTLLHFVFFLSQHHSIYLPPSVPRKNEICYNSGKGSLKVTYHIILKIILQPCDIEEP